MKLILSRKGVDAACGGVPSPILPDGTPLSLPIPYADPVRRYGNVSYNGQPLAAITAPLSRGRLGAERGCHLDPDLRFESLPRAPGWRPLFGQVGAAQTHLRNQQVQVGDLFLFFGWFRETEYRNGALRFIPGAPDWHVLYGWLQIGASVALSAARPPPWAAYHPHCHGRWGRNNTLYIAAKTLRGLPGSERIAGAGAFGRYRDALRLTRPGGGRSTWELPGWLYPRGQRPALSYHAKPERWRRANGRTILRAAAQGQEFVLDAARYPRALAWAGELIASG